MIRLSKYCLLIIGHLPIIQRQDKTSSYKRSSLQNVKSTKCQVTKRQVHKMSRHTKRQGIQNIMSTKCQGIHKVKVYKTSTLKI